MQKKMAEKLIDLVKQKIEQQIGGTWEVEPIGFHGDKGDFSIKLKPSEPMSMDKLSNKSFWDKVNAALSEIHFRLYCGVQNNYYSVRLRPKARRVATPSSS